MNEIGAALISSNSNNLSISSRNCCNKNSLIDVRMLTSIAGLNQLLTSVTASNNFKNLLDSTQKHALSLTLKVNKNVKNEYLPISSAYNNNLATTSTFAQPIKPFLSTSTVEQNTRERSRNLKIKKECPHCNFTTYMSQHMKSHLEAHERHRGQMYQCDICYTEFSQKANMHRHRTRHSGIKPYRCRFCEKEFFRKDQMQEHSMTHIKTGDDFDCPVVDCNQKFNQHQTLRQHLDSDHVISPSSQARCKRCAIMFANPRRLLLHYQTKHDDFQIDNNLKMYKNVTNLKNENVDKLKTKTSVFENYTNPVLQENNKTNELSKQKLKKTAQLLVNNKNLKALKRRADYANSKSNISDSSKSVNTLSLNNYGYNVEELLKNRVSITPNKNDETQKIMVVNKKKKLNNMSSKSTSNLQFFNNKTNNVNKDLNSVLINAASDTYITNNKNFLFNSLFNKNVTLINSFNTSKKTIKNEENFFKTIINTPQFTESSNNTSEIHKNFKSFNTTFSHLFNVNSSNESKFFQKESNYTKHIENDNYLPLSKSPNYQKLMFNSCKSSNDNNSILKINGNCLQKSSASIEKNKKALEHHLQLWTNQANRTATFTTLSSSTSFQNDEFNLINSLQKNENNFEANLLINENTDHTFFATHSPTASSSSTISSIGANSDEKILLPQWNSSNDITRSNKFNLISKKTNCLNLLNIMHNTKKNLKSNLSNKDCLKNNIVNPDTNENSWVLLSAVATNANKIFGVSYKPMECLYCGILFKDQTLYLLHKDLHSEIDIWRCNLCGKTCGDKYTFTMHLIRANHS